MKPTLCFVLISLLAMLAGCEDADFKTRDASGFSKSDRFDAMQRGTVLPGMIPKQVTEVWGQPQGRQKTAEGEEWIYRGGAGGSYDVHTTVKFAGGKVTEVLNADLMAGRGREILPDMAPDMHRGGGGPANGGPSFGGTPGLQGAGF